VLDFYYILYNFRWLLFVVCLGMKVGIIYYSIRIEKEATKRDTSSKTYFLNRQSPSNEYNMNSSEEYRYSDAIHS